ncbi:MAG: 1,4-dihydroxy-2-naphthoate octaprenyltransferase [Bryobacteraceae bacterium]|nr:1,4-dihydroxy-2-naphthoate octaprenyltransferase [Bryobacteraceae bacterium]
MASSAANTPSHPIAVWLQACRVQSLAISTIGVWSGVALAAYDGWFDPAKALLAWLASVLIQAGTNLINVHHNYKAHSTSDARASSAVLRFGLLTSSQVRNGGLACFGAGMTAGIALAYLSGPVILAIGIPSIAAGYFYAGPPVRLGYLGLGVVTVLIFMGPVMVCGSYFVMAGHVSAGAVALSIAIGMLAASVMHINDLRDYDADRKHGKRTLATLLGRGAARWALAAMVAVAFKAVLGGVLAAWLPLSAVVVLAGVPLAVPPLRLVFRETDPAALNRAWFAQVRLHLIFGLLLIAGLAAALWIR